MIIDETDRLIIKEIELNEAKEAARLLSLFQENVTEYTEEMVEAYIKVAYGFYGYGYWGVYDKITKRLIGLAGFREGSCPLEIGYALTEDARGKGYATEAVKSLVDFAEEDFMWVIEDQEEDEHDGKPLKNICPSSDSERVFAIKKRDKVLVYGRTEKDNGTSVKVLLNNGFTEMGKSYKDR